MPPSECLDGTTAECAHLHLLLACFRASPPPMRLPGVTGRPLPDMLAAGIIDPDVFHTGYAIMAARYERLGIRALLPLERVWAGTRSAARPSTARSHGGFHHPAQGYRHIQMDAAVTVFGDLTGHTPVSPQAAAMDLVRTYAHDCLHYARFRRYRLTDRGEIARVQYGINFRQPDGRTYSAPDIPGDGPTRNLGIVMEGATDAEATAIARQTAQSCGITVADSVADVPGLAFADVTGTVTASDIGAALLLDHPYARPLRRFGRTVTLRYRALLGDLDASATDTHSQIITAMISGDLAPQRGWMLGTAPAASPGCSGPRPSSQSPNWLGDAAPAGQAAQFRPGPPGDQQARYQVAHRRAGVRLLRRFPLGGHRSQRRGRLRPHARRRRAPQLGRHDERRRAGIAGPGVPDASRVPAWDLAHPVLAALQARTW